MTPRISISAEVNGEILSTSAYYEGLREGLGTEFEKALDVVLENIRSNPNMYPQEFGPVRRAMIRRFNMAVFYAVRPTGIFVVEVRDLRREPPDWESRGFTSH